MLLDKKTNQPEPIIGTDKGRSTKVNIIVWLKLELSYYYLAVKHFRYYATETPQKLFILDRNTWYHITT